MAALQSRQNDSKFGTYQWLGTVYLLQHYSQIEDKRQLHWWKCGTDKANVSGRCEWQAMKYIHWQLNSNQHCLALSSDHEHCHLIHVRCSRCWNFKLQASSSEPSRWLRKSPNSDSSKFQQVPTPGVLLIQLCGVRAGFAKLKPTAGGFSQDQRTGVYFTRYLVVLVFH